MRGGSIFRCVKSEVVQRQITLNKHQRLSSVRCAEVMLCCRNHYLQAQHQLSLLLVRFHVSS